MSFLYQTFKGIHVKYDIKKGSALSAIYLYTVAYYKFVFRSIRQYQAIMLKTCVQYVKLFLLCTLLDVFLRQKSSRYPLLLNFMASLLTLYGLNLRSVKFSITIERIKHKYVQERIRLIGNLSAES